MLYQKGEHIADYTVAFPHKQGAYAETYRVKDLAGKTRFLKLIDYSRLSRHQIGDDGQIVEVEIQKQCFHHNLCSLLDSGILLVRGKQYAYAVTEYVSGETLVQYMARNEEVSVYEIKQIAKAVLAALDYLHSLSVPVVHGEVTPGNILLNLTGDWCDLKLIDLGHARFLDHPPVKPNLDAMNPFYLAPECLSGVACVQSDLYAVGVMMYQLLYGKLPWFVDLSRVRSADRINRLLVERRKELDIPELEIFELDDQFVNCVIKALSYDVEDRFRTAKEFMRAIDGEIKIERQSSRHKILSGPHDSSQVPVVRKPGEGQGFAAVAGMDELKEQLREEVIEPLHHPEEYARYGVTIPNGMLLYGPPGCGKTFFAKHFAEEVGFNFMCVTPASLKSRYVNATQENIAQMFKEAGEKAPTVIFIDEINELVPNRESDVHEMSRSAVNEMLAQMDRTGERRIFVIGATNYPHSLDPAILRAGRLDKKYYVGVPDVVARESLFRLYLGKRPYDFGLDYEELARLTENYVSADIQLIVNDASRAALKARSKITMALLRMTIAATRPSLSVSELKRYLDIKAKMEGAQPVRKKIGF